jgi:hemerythrin superfamily protein
MSTTQAKTRPQEATAMLRADHEKVSGLFQDFDKARSAERKRALAAQICTELTIHTQIEEEIFYPAVKEALGDHELVPEANIEHGSIKDLISQVQLGEQEGEVFEARVKVMGEYVKHHVKEEHDEMFPKARKAELDMRELGARMAGRKAELLGTAH